MEKICKVAGTRKNFALLKNSRRKLNIFLLFMLGPYQLMGGFDYRNLVVHKYGWMIAGLVLLGISMCKPFFVWRRENRMSRLDGVRYASIGVLAGCILISTILSDDWKVSVCGAWSQYNGIITYLLLLLGAVCVEPIGNDSRDLRFYLEWFLGFSVISALWGIINSYGFDLFYMHAKIAYEDRYFYYAGIGQKTIYAEILLMATCISCIFYVLEEVRNKRIYYGFVCGILFYAGYLSLSDNYFFGIIPALWLTLPWTIKNKEGKLRVLDMVIILLALGFLIQCAGPNVFRYHGAFAMPKDPISFDAVAGVLVESLFSRVLLVLLISIRVILGIRVKKQGVLQGEFCSNQERRFGIHVTILIAGVALLVAFMIYIPRSNLILPFGRFLGYFRFDDDWGSGRGFLWKNCVTIFSESSMICKIFGSGADCIGQKMVDFFGDYAFRNGATYNNAHNEFLGMLLCHGIIGVTSYLIWFGTVVKNLVNRIREKNPGENPTADDSEEIALLAAILGYVIQSIVGLNNVAVLPIFFIWIGLGGALRAGHPAEMLTKARNE